MTMEITIALGLGIVLVLAGMLVGMKIGYWQAEQNQKLDEWVREQLETAANQTWHDYDENEQ
jgi:hypothetical protein